MDKINENRRILNPENTTPKSIVIEIGAGNPAKTIEILKIEDDLVKITFRDPEKPGTASDCLLGDKEITELHQLLSKTVTPQS